MDKITDKEGIVSGRILASLLFGLGTVCGQTGAGEIVVAEGIVYAVHGGEELKLDLALPAEAGDKGKGNLRPAIVFIHGGAWRRGSREAYRAAIRQAAELDYAAITISYRFAPEHVWPAQWDDVRAAVLWLRRHSGKYHIDPHRIGVTGASAGGHLSLMLGAFPDGKTGEDARVQAVVNYFGPAELSSDHYADRVKPLIRDLAGGTLAEKPVVYEAASPLSHVSTADAPVLTFHGTTDKTVPVDQARMIHKALASNRVPNELVLLEGKGHGWGGDDRQKTTERMFAFFDRYLKVSDLPLLLVEDFDSGDAHRAERWQPTDKAAWRAGERQGDGFYSLIKRKSDYAPKVRSPLNISVLQDVEVTDFVLDVQLRSTEKDYGHRSLCLFFGYQSPTRFYYVHFGKKADAHANSIFLVNDQPRVSIARERTDGTAWDDHWHRARIRREVDTGRIEVFFDDMEKPVMWTVDHTFGHGRVGIGSFDDRGDFDIVRLWGKKR